MAVLYSGGTGGEQLFSGKINYPAELFTFSRVNFPFPFHFQLSPFQVTRLMLASGRRRVSVSGSWVTTATFALARVGAARRVGTRLAIYGGHASQQMRTKVSMSISMNILLAQADVKPADRATKRILRNFIVEGYFWKNR